MTVFVRGRSGGIEQLALAHAAQVSSHAAALSSLGCPCCMRESSGAECGAFRPQGTLRDSAQLGWTGASTLIGSF